MRDTRETILLTGITGNLGSWLASEMVRAGKRVLALMRDKNNEISEKRLALILDIVGVGNLRHNIEIIHGDICKKGLVPESSRLTSISKIVHCAACTKFQEDGEELSHITNIRGTRNVLDLATRLCVPVVHISSAYIAGKRTGVVKESEIDVGQTFNNVYEKTKCQSEILVHEWQRTTSLPATILRPSIVMGDSKYGRTVHFNSMYDFIRILNLVVPYLGKDKIRIATKPDVTKNIIPVDYFAQVASHIINKGIAGTYHITNPIPLAMKDFGEILSQLFKLNQYKLVETDSFLRHKPNRIEKLIQEATSTYGPYIVSEPIFDRANTDKILAGNEIELPLMGLSYFNQLLNYARSAKWRRNLNPT